jgi:hypothetical protein
MNPKIIVIDGKTYHSVNEMPEDVRRQYEQAMSSFRAQNANQASAAVENNDMLADKNQNGIPDIVENSPGAPVIANAIKILVDGKQFNRIEDLPPEARAKYEQAMGALDANRNGIPDFVEGMMGTGAQQPATPIMTVSEAQAARPAARTPISSPSAITPDTSNGWMLALLGLFLLFLCAATAAGVWYFFLR